MTSKDLTSALATSYPLEICRDLVGEYQHLRMDYAVGTLGRSSPGKIVEGLVQILEFIADGKCSSAPKVELALSAIQGNSSLDDGLRLCAARVGLAMYTLRNKRGVIHKSGLAPNRADLGFLLAAAQWILAELLRNAKGISMAEADGLVRMLQAPIATLVEDTGTRRIVLADLRARDEALVLLQSYYPDRVDLRSILTCLDRIPEKTVRNVLQTLWRQKLVDRNDMQFRLTLRGLQEAASTVREIQAA